MISAIVFEGNMLPNTKRSSLIRLDVNLMEYVPDRASINKALKLLAKFMKKYVDKRPNRPV